jgi:hypothetical protein
MADARDIPAKGTTSKENTAGRLQSEFSPSPRPAVTARIAMDCPLCGSPLQVRTNRVKRVAFMGCTGYPGCSFSESADNLVADMAREIATLEAKLREVRP